MVKKNHWASYYSMKNGGGNNCKCPKMTWVAYVSANGVSLYGKQCMNCGKFEKKAKSSIPPETIVVPRNEEKFEQYRVKKGLLLKEALKKDLNKKKESKNLIRTFAYKKYLASPKWKKKRELRLERCFHAQNGAPMCDWCGEKEATEVHHLTYDRFENERLTDLAALCFDCHKAEHANRKWDE